jgi:hypothetical protein
MAQPGEHGPVAVSIIVFGDNTKNGKKFIADWHDLSARFPMYDPIDVRAFFSKDPSKSRQFKSYHDKNADHTETQISLHQFEDFFYCCQYLVNQVQEKFRECDPPTIRLPKILPVFCSAGQHRADGAAKNSVHRVLNALELGCGRCYNANVFSLNGANDIEDRLKTATRWLSNPWSINDARETFGVEACASSPRAQFVYAAVGQLKAVIEEGVHDLISKTGALIVPDFSDDEEEIECTLVPKPPSHPPTRSVAKKRPASSKAIRVNEGADKPTEVGGDGNGLEPFVMPPPPPPAPTLAGYKRGRDDDRDTQTRDQRWYDDDRGQHSRDQRWYDDDQRSYSHSPCVFCAGSGVLTHNDAADSFDALKYHPKLLMSILRAHNVDADAEQEAYLLATRFEYGWAKLNDIVHNLVKNYGRVENASAFVAASCIKTRKAHLPKSF